MLDAVAASLEAKGLVKEASEVDAVSNSVEAVMFELDEPTDEEIGVGGKVKLSRVSSKNLVSLEGSLSRNSDGSFRLSVDKGFITFTPSKLRKENKVEGTPLVGKEYPTMRADKYRYGVTLQDPIDSFNLLAL